MMTYIGIVKATDEKTCAAMRRIVREMNREYTTRSFTFRIGEGQVWIDTENQGGGFDDAVRADARARIQKAGLA